MQRVHEFPQKDQCGEKFGLPFAKAVLSTLAKNPYNHGPNLARPRRCHISIADPRRQLVTRRLPAPPRSTLYLSAGLLLLPATGMAQSTGDWNCRVVGDSWQCDGGPASPAPASTTSVPRPVVPAPVVQPPPAQPVSAKPLVEEAAALPPPAAAPLADDWDYVRLQPGEQPASGCCAPRRNCEGYYREPARDWLDAQAKPTGLPLRANAAESEWVGDIVKLDGEIIVTQGDTKLTATAGEFNQATHVAHLRGNVVLRQPGTRISGSEAELNIESNDGTLQNARFLDYQTGARVTADTLRRKGENRLTLQNARYTTCPPDDEDWRLQARRIRLNRETGRGVATHALLKAGPVPVFYSPWLDFPIDDRRKSGFLSPTLSNSSSGLDLTVPYYLNLAPNYDATLAPRLVTDRGTMLEAEARYLNQLSYWVANGAYLDNDRRTDESRWLGSLKQNGRINQYWSTLIDYSKVSDDDYFHDLGLASLDARRMTGLNQQAVLSFGYTDWFARADLQQYQTINPFISDAYRKLPQLTVGRYAGADNFTLDYSVLVEATRFDHRDSISNGGTFVTGDRYYMEPGLVLPMRWAAGYLQPEVRLRSVAYALDEAVPGGSGDTSPNATQFQGIIDSGLYFERETRFGETGYLQTLEPRLYYLYSPYEGQGDQPNFDSSPLTFNYQQLFQPRRFTGHDRLEDFDQVSVGVTSRFIEDASGRESFSASIGQIYYLSDRQITTLAATSVGASQTVETQPSSAIASQLTWEPTDSLWTSANLLWDTDESRVDQGNIYLHYSAANGALYNFGYRKSQANPLLSTLNQGIDQVDAAAVLPLSQQWRAFARFNYELQDHSPLETLFGLEYEDCCWAVRLVYQKALDSQRVDNSNLAEARREETVMLEFQLKGLGSMGQQTERQLKESIWGFR
jgi:LPS-assembly protein